MNTKTRKLVVTGLLVAFEAILNFTPIGMIRIGPVAATTMHIPVIIGAVLEGPLVGGVLGLCFGLFSMLNAILTPTIFSPIFYNPLIAVLPRILVGIGSGYLFKAFVKLDALEKNNKTGHTIGAAVYVLGTLALSYGAFYYIGLFAGRIAGISETLKLVIAGIPAVLILVIAAVFFKKYLHGDKRDIGAAVTGVAGTCINTIGVLGLMALLESQRVIAAVPSAANALGAFFTGIILTNSIPEAIVACIITALVFKAMKIVYDRRQPKPLAEEKKQLP